MVLYVFCICMEKILYRCILLHISISFCLWIQWHYVGSLKSAMVGTFILWISANTTNQNLIYCIIDCLESVNCVLHILYNGKIIYIYIYIKYAYIYIYIYKIQKSGNIGDHFGGWQLVYLLATDDSYLFHMQNTLTPLTRPPKISTYYNFRLKSKIPSSKSGPDTHAPPQV